MSTPQVPKLAQPSTFAQRLELWRSFVIPVGFILLLVVIIVPLPTLIIDLLVATNISIAAIVLLTTVYLEKPLEFSVFPSLLLGTTLFRLCLNVATTRLILTADANTPEEARHVAGEVISAFGKFVAGDSPIVGTVIFCIMVIVQFVVITKGATRISEVAARFTLDAMPGKQMAIDADLTAGMIDENEARARREEIRREADFYGAMDGASKFVRGDAVAGIIITAINIIGGFIVGAVYKGWGITESLGVFTHLTIGDGLVSQIPSFIISIAAGLIVARAGSEADLGSDLTRQLSGKPRALYFTAGFLVIMSFTGLPPFPMLTCAALIVTIGLLVDRSTRDVRHRADTEREAKAAAETKEAPIDDLLKIDLLEIEVGYGLVRLVNKAGGGTLLDRISMIRRQLAGEMGFVLPPVRIRDNSELDAHAYRIKLRGATIADGLVYPDLWLAMDSGLASGDLDGIPTREPAFGLDARWIEPALRNRAESRGFTVVDATSVLITHFSEVVKRHMDELLTREEVNNLIATLKERAPRLVEEAIPEKVKPGELQRVLQALLHERIPIRDLEIILETLADWIEHTRDPDILVEYVRNALKRTIASLYLSPEADGKPRLHCVTADPRLEDVINSHVNRTGSSTLISLPPNLVSGVTGAVSEAVRSLTNAGRPAVVLTSPQTRGPLRKVIEPYLPTVAVLGYNEIPPGLEVESAGLVKTPARNAEAPAAA